MQPDYVKDRVNLLDVYLKAEDVETTGGNLRFKVYNTLDFSLYYKNALITRIYDNL